jgi:replication factor C small subunit
MTESLKTRNWVDKYRPDTLDGYVFSNDEQKLRMERLITQKIPGHVLLSGVQGTGKTTFAKILIKECGVLDEDLLVIDAALDNRVEVIRERIIQFASIMPSGDFRVVQLEECDNMSTAAQGVLRKVMEDEVDDVKFILTCNFPHKIIAPLKSRIQYDFTFKAPDKKQVLKRVITIILSEGIKPEPDVITQYVEGAYPDIRKIIQNLQSGTVDGTLLAPEKLSAEVDYRYQFVDLIKSGQWNQIHDFVEQQVSDGDIEGIYEFLYDNLEKSPGFARMEDKWKTGIVLIAEYLHQHAFTSLPKKTLATLIIRLSMIN